MDSETSAAPHAALAAEAHALDPALTTLLEAGSDLNESVRRGIMAMVEAAGRKEVWNPCRLPRVDLGPSVTDVLGGFRLAQSIAASPC